MTAAIGFPWRLVLTLLVAGSLSSGTCLAQFFCVDPPADMLGWWPGDGHAEDLLGDSHGTLVGDATFAPGLVDLAFALDGDGDSVAVSDDGSLGVGAGDFTIDFWIRLSDALDGNRIIVQKWDSLNERGFTVWHVGGWLCADVNRAGLCYPADIGDGLWHHVAYSVERDVISSAATIRLWVDGAIWDTVTQNLNSYANSNPLLLGNGVDPYSLPIDYLDLGGLLDEVELHDRALSLLELDAVRWAGSAGKCKPPLADCVLAPLDLAVWWPFDETFGPVAQDIAGGNDGTHVNAPLPTAGMVDLSLKFDGTTQSVLAPTVQAHDPGDITIDAWIFPEQTADPQIVLEHRVQGSLLIYDLGLWDGSLFFTPCNDDACYIYKTTGLYIPAGTWTHVAVTADTATDEVAFYINGNPVACETSCANYAGDTYLIYGFPREWSIGPSFDGRVDELQIFERPLRHEEIESIYLAGDAGKCKDVGCCSADPVGSCLDGPLAGCAEGWSVLECHGDAGGNGMDDACEAVVDLRLDWQWDGPANKSWTTFVWDTHRGPAYGHVRYDLVRGGLETLVAGGDFMPSVGGCIVEGHARTDAFCESAHSGAECFDPDPGSGHGLWYLVRASWLGAIDMSYDTTGPGQHHPRDAEIEASVLACP